MLLLSVLWGLASVMPADSARKRLTVFPLPLVYYTPETRLAYGAAATVTVRFQRDAGDTIARPSQLTVGAAYTQNRQLLLYLPFQVFYDHNRYYAYGEVGYYRYTYYFFGAGQRQVPRELYGVHFPRLRLNAFHRVVPTLRRGQLYAGVRYQVEDYQIKRVTAGGLLAENLIPGSRGSQLTGGGVGLFYDARNQVFFPTKGLVADVAFWYQNRAVGAGLQGQTTRFNRYSLDVSSYHALPKRAVLALNYFASFTTGVAPFNALSLLGGTKRLRGYYEGRFRDHNAALLQTELRANLYHRLGAVVFGSVGVLGDHQQALRLNRPKGAYGGGLRFAINRRDHLNLRLDYGVGRQSTGFYLTVGEAF